MTTVTGAFGVRRPGPDILSGTPREHAIDRWIFVFMAAWFIAIVLAGFIPDSLMKIEMVQTGQRPPFPLVLHMHAVLMGAFLLLLLTQTWLMATGRRGPHMKLGIAGLLGGVAIVIVGFVLIPTMYHQLWNSAQAAPPVARAPLQQAIRIWDNITLLQIRIGLLFPLFLAIGIKARGTDAGMHKRMMILATAIPLPAGIDRIPWLPHTMPGSPWSVDLYTFAAISPMLIWDVARNGRVHRAYWIVLTAYLPCAIAVHTLWNTDWWHSLVPRLMGVI